MKCCYTYAVQFLMEIENQGFIWGNLGETPDNKKERLLKKYKQFGLTIPYVDGVYDARNKSGEYYKEAIAFLENEGKNWNGLGEEYKKQLITGKNLDIAYVDGIADVIKNEKSKHADSDRVSEEQL